MFKKKQTPPVPGRNVPRPTNANVFSYYKSRSNAESTSPRRTDFAEEPKKRSFSGKFLAYTPSILAGVVVMFCMIYVTTLSPMPNVRFVGSESSRRLVSDPSKYESEIKKLLEASVINQSKLIINTEKVAENIEEEFPELGEVAVLLPLVGRQPIVEVKPTDPQLVLVSKNETFIVDENGRTIAYAADTESSIRDKLPIVIDDSGVSFELGNFALPNEAVALSTEVYAQLSDKQIPIQTMTIPLTTNELHIRLDDRPYFIKFDLRGNGRLQAGSFLAVYEHLEQQKKTPNEYIDVRVPGKAFYK